MARYLLEKKERKNADRFESLKFKDELHPYTAHARDRPEMKLTRWCRTRMRHDRLSMSLI